MGSPAKADVAVEFGADAVVDYTTPGWVAKVRWAVRADPGVGQDIPDGRNCPGRLRLRGCRVETGLTAGGGKRAHVEDPAFATRPPRTRPLRPGPRGPGLCDPAPADPASATRPLRPGPRGDSRHRRAPPRPTAPPGRRRSGPPRAPGQHGTPAASSATTPPATTPPRHRPSAIGDIPGWKFGRGGA
uniref:hypothetical protein n=1 Tax=Frankia casuarinae (strain DSM 45818 / CECT 9043 / HFP020203 / CcI3) TaxID=106370 RepID=UPI0036F373FB